MGNFLSGTSGEQHLVEGTAPWYRYHAKNRTELGHAAFARSQAAYKNGDHSAAKKLSVEGKEHQRKAKELNDQAAALIFKDQNSDRNSGEVDLHGLKVTEAIQYAEQAVQAAKAEGRKRLVLIVGQGRHSADGVPKLKPAVLSMVNKHNLRCIPNHPNPGCITVEFVDKSQRGWFANVLAGMCVIC